MMLGVGMGFGLLGLVLMALFWIGIIAAVVWIARSIFSNGQQGFFPSGSAKENPRDILDRRYARGEITREQYDLMKQEIS